MTCLKKFFLLILVFFVSVTVVLGVDSSQSFKDSVLSYTNGTFAASGCLQNGYYDAMHIFNKAYSTAAADTFGKDHTATRITNDVIWFYLNDTYLFNFDSGSLFERRVGNDIDETAPHGLSIELCDGESSCILIAGIADNTNGCNKCQSTAYEQALTAYDSASDIFANRIKITVNSSNCDQCYSCTGDSKYNYLIMEIDLDFDSAPVAVGSNHIPGVEIMYNNSNLCFNTSLGVAEFDYWLNATDPENDSLRYLVTSGFNFKHDLFIDFDDGQYNTTQGNFWDDTMYWLYCVSPLKALDLCDTFDKFSVDLDFRDFNYVFTNCNITESFYLNDEIYIGYDSEHYYKMAVNGSLCSQFGISKNNYYGDMFINSFYIEFEENSSIEYASVYTFNLFDIIKFERFTDENITVSFNGSAETVINATSFILTTNIDFINSVATFYFYDSSYSSEILLYSFNTTDLGNTVAWGINFFPLSGIVYLDDISFYINQPAVADYQTSYVSPFEFADYGSYFVRAYVTDIYHPDSFSSYDDVFVTVSGYCTDSVIDMDRFPDSRQERGSLETFLYVMRQIINIPAELGILGILKAAGSFFYLVIFLKFFIVSGNFFLSLLKSSLIVFIYGLIGLTYLSVLVISAIMLAFSLVAFLKRGYVSFAGGNE